MIRRTHDERTRQGREHEVVPTPLPWHHELRRDGTVALRTRKQIEGELIRRALKDAPFRQALIDDPHAAALQALGVALPAGVSVTVLEESDTVVHLVLPAFPHPGISEAELVASTGLTYEDIAEGLVADQAVPLLPPADMRALVARAWRDDGFARRLLDDAAGTLDRELGVRFGGDRRVAAFAETAGAVAMVLPNVADMVARQEAWEEQEDELMANILASPCNNSHPDPCCTRTWVLDT